MKYHDHFINIFHAMDHIQRLHDRCYEDAGRVVTLKSLGDTKQDREKIATVFVEIINDLENDDGLAAAERANELAAHIENRVEILRHTIMENVADNHISAETGTTSLDAVHWLKRVSSHVARLTHHLAAI